MRRISRGFTIIEVLIVVAVIGILATISLVGFNRYQADTRDAQRSSKATIIAEALEKYYDKNGEYPSCPAITAVASTVTTTTLIGLEQNTLQTPTDTSETNSIKCQDLANASQDRFAYVGGDNSATCLSGSACALFTLKYIEESSGSIKSIQGRRRVTVSGAPLMNCSAISFTGASCDWSPVDGATSYDLKYTDENSVVVTINSIVASSNPGYGASGLDYCKPYSFQARAVGVSGPGDWSSPVSITTFCVAVPSIISITANSVSQITVSWGSAENAASYSLQYDNDSDFGSLTGSPTGITTTSYAATGLTPGTTYYFKVKSVNGSYNSAYSTPPATATTPNPVLSGQGSCSASYSARPNYRIDFVWTEVSYDINANTSNVTWVAYRTPNINISSPNGTYDETLPAGWTFNAVIDGQTVLYGGQGRSGRWRQRGVTVGQTEAFYGTNTTANSSYSGTVTITHNADGAKTVGTSAYDGSTGIFGTASCSGSYVLSDLR